jgi:tetratricopeptide (TPR) repeat protein
MGNGPNPDQPLEKSLEVVLQFCTPVRMRSDECAILRRGARRCDQLREGPAVSLIIGIKIVKEALSALETIRKSADLFKYPATSAGQRAIELTANKFATTFPDLRRQLLELLTSGELRSLLEAFEQKGALDVHELVERLRAASLYLPAEQDVEAAERAMEFFLDAFNRELLGDPATGLPTVDARSSARDAALAEHLSAVQETLERNAATTDRIAAAVGTDPGDEHAALRTAAAAVPMAAALKMYELFESRLRRTGGWSREVEAQVELEKGAAAWRSGEPQLAAKFFERAYELNSADLRIRVNSGLALAVRERWDEALARIDAVLRDAPDNARALTAKAQVLRLAGRMTDALAALRTLTSSPSSGPDNFRLHIGVAIAEGLFDEAVEIAERGLSASPDGTCRAAVALAYQARADAAYRSGRVDAAVRADLARARDSYRAAIESARATESRRLLVESLVGLARVLTISGVMEEALASAREAHALDPSDAQAALTLAMTALASRQPQEAFAVAEPLARAGTPDAASIAFDAFCELNPTGTVQELESMLAALRLKAEDLPFHPFEALLSAALRESSITADSLVARWSSGTPAQRSLVDARIFFARGDSSSALARAKAATAELRKAPDLLVTIRLGDLLREHSAPAAAAAAYEVLPVTEGSPDFVVANHVTALLGIEGSDAEERVLELAARFAAAGRESAPVSYAEATVLERRGELARAQQLWSSLASRDPARSSKYNLAVARCASRRDRPTEVAAALDAITDVSTLSAEDLFTSAELRKRLCQYDRALDDAYAALKRAPDDAAVGFNYLVLYMALPEAATQKKPPDRVADGSIVTLEFSAGEEHAVAIGAVDSPFDASQYSAASEEAQLLLGKSAGEALTWATGPAGDITATIKDVAHPYAYAAKTLLRTISHRFPGRSPISSVAVGENFEGTKRVLAAQSAKDDELLALARAHPVPIALLAQRLGRDLFRLWASLESIQFKILLTTNTIQDVSADAQALRSARAIVLDPLSLLDLKALNLLDRFAARFPDLIVPQASFDVLLECRDSLLEDASRGDLLSVGIHRGDLAPSLLSKAQLEDAAGFISDVLRFCDAKCKRSGRPRPLTPREEELRKLLTDGFFLPVLIAGEGASAGTRLLANEAVVRALGREVCGASSFSVLAFLESELSGGSMPRSDYADALQFLLRRTRHVTLHAGHLTYLVTATRPLSEYGLAVDALLDPDLPRDPALRVAFAHVRELVFSAVVWESAAQYLQMLFIRIAKRHGQASVGAIRKALQAAGLLVVPNLDRAIRLAKLCEDSQRDSDSLLL